MKHKHYECIVAWAEGKKIQNKDELGEWIDTENPRWFRNTEYRIKPNTKKFRVALNRENNHIWTIHCTTDEGAAMVESNTYFHKWITDWIEYEA